MVAADPLQHLLRYAEEHAAVSVEASKGRCLHASVRLALEAEALGLGGRLRFVRWRVQDDPFFREHWAIAVDDEQVLDLTAVQVGGDRQPFRRLAAYPKNYSGRRFYPLQTVLRPLMRRHDGSGRYARCTIWTVQRHMAAFDARQSFAQRSATGVFAAAGRLAEASYVLVVDYLLQSAIKRLGRLLLKLG